MAAPRAAWASPLKQAIRRNPPLPDVRRRHKLLVSRLSQPRFQRHLHVEHWSAPPLILTGLFVALWCWKCTMLVLFQNTIIYNPFMPPNARSMRIEEFAKQCRGIRWREERIRSLDGTEIALCVSDSPTSDASKTPVYILYFQGWLETHRMYPTEHA